MPQTTAIAKAKRNAEAEFNRQKELLVDGSSAGRQRAVATLTKRYRLHPESFYSINDCAEIAYERKRSALRRKLKRRLTSQDSAESLVTETSSIQEDLSNLDKRSFLRDYIRQHKHQQEIMNGKENENNVIDMNKANGLPPPVVVQPPRHGQESNAMGGHAGGHGVARLPTLRPEWKDMMGSSDPQVRMRALDIIANAVDGIVSGNLTLAHLPTQDMMGSSDPQVRMRALDIIANAVNGIGSGNRTLGGIFLEDSPQATHEQEEDPRIIYV